MISQCASLESCVPVFRLWTVHLYSDFIPQIRLPTRSQPHVRNHRREDRDQPTHPDHHHVFVVRTLQHIKENTNVHHEMVENRCKYEVNGANVFHDNSLNFTYVSNDN
ncbi:unnamed protein product [Schistosoma spindalis]|nr:unnamed protein product [Schistosoma spindale]